MVSTTVDHLHDTQENKENEFAAMIYAEREAQSKKEMEIEHHDPFRVGRHCWTFNAIRPTEEEATFVRDHCTWNRNQVAFNRFDSESIKSHRIVWNTDQSAFKVRDEENSS